MGEAPFLHRDPLRASRLVRVFACIRARACVRELDTYKKEPIALVLCH